MTKLAPVVFLLDVVVISAMHLLQGVPAEAQQSAKLQPETKVVLRISRKFILELTGKQFKRDEPVDQNASGTSVKGNALVNGTFDVKLQKSDKSSDFDLLVNGKVLTQLVATSRTVQVYTHGTAAFSGCRRIVFDGNAFTGQVIEMNVTYHSSIDQLCSFRKGLIGAVTRGIARRSASCDLPKSDRQTGKEIRTRVTTAIEKETDEFVVTMNKVGPLLTKGEKILHDEKVLSARSVQVYLAATEQHLYLSIGPPEHRIPSLPRLNVSQRGPIELWIAIEKSSKKDLLNPVLEHWNLIKPFVLKRIAKREPELVKIIEQVRVESVGGWYVVRFAPKLLELP